MTSQWLDILNHSTISIFLIFYLSRSYVLTYFWQCWCVLSRRSSPTTVMQCKLSAHDNIAPATFGDGIMQGNSIKTKNWFAESRENSVCLSFCRQKNICFTITRLHGLILWYFSLTRTRDEIGEVIRDCWWVFHALLSLRLIGMNFF